jgi:predicted nucleic acid-binding protein
VTYVVDTDILRDHLRERGPATRTLEDALRSGRRVAASVLTRVELRRSARPEQLAAIDALDVLVDWVPVDHEIAALAEQHASRLGHAHPELDASAFIVAATAERLDGELLTGRADRFPMYPRLRPIP